MKKSYAFSCQVVSLFVMQFAIPIFPSTFPLQISIELTVRFMGDFLLFLNCNLTHYRCTPDYPLRLSAFSLSFHFKSRISTDYTMTSSWIYPMTAPFPQHIFVILQMQHFFFSDLSYDSVVSTTYSCYSTDVTLLLS